MRECSKCRLVFDDSVLAACPECLGCELYVVGAAGVEPIDVPLNWRPVHPAGEPRSDVAARYAQRMFEDVRAHMMQDIARVFRIPPEKLKS